MSRVVEVFQVDAFTSEPFGGNPAGVVPDAQALSEKSSPDVINVRLVWCL